MVLVLNEVMDMNCCLNIDNSIIGRLAESEINRERDRGKKPKKEKETLQWMVLVLNKFMDMNCCLNIDNSMNGRLAESKIKRERYIKREIEAKSRRKIKKRSNGWSWS